MRNFIRNTVIIAVVIAAVIALINPNLIARALNRVLLGVAFPLLLISVAFAGILGMFRGKSKK